MLSFNKDSKLAQAWPLLSPHGEHATSHVYTGLHKADAGISRPSHFENPTVKHGATICTLSCGGIETHHRLRYDKATTSFASRTGTAMLLNSADAIAHYGYILFSKQSSRHVPVKATTASAVSILETCSPNSKSAGCERRKRHRQVRGMSLSLHFNCLGGWIIEPGM